MTPWKILRRIRFKHLVRVIGYGLQYPLFIWPTIKATEKTMSISTAHYGKKHVENGPANAFRHALWNYLIAKECTKWSKKRDKTIRWAKIITDWHENAFQNRELPRRMDLHNNEVGRKWFVKLLGHDEKKAVEKFMELAKESKPISMSSDLKLLKNQLVHIKNEA